MQINKSLLVPFLLSTFLLLSCNKSSDNQLSNLSNDTTDPEKLIRLTDAQALSAGIITCPPDSLYTGSIVCEGEIVVPPEKIVFITAPSGGIVRFSQWQPGDYVRKGQLLTVLEHPDYLKIQQEYLETKSQWEYYKEEFKRQGELTVENATSVKIMQQAQVNFRTTEVRLISLKNQLELLGINSDTLNIENITYSVKIHAPISGCISEINAYTGKYVDARQSLFEIVDKSTPDLVLKVHANYIHLLQKGQRIEFFLNNDSTLYTAILKSISPKLDRNNNTFKVTARIIKSPLSLQIGLPVRAKINCGRYEGMYVPLSSVIYDNNQPVIFLKSPDGFKRVILENYIITGGRMNLQGIPRELKNDELVINGAFYLNTLWHKL